MPEGFALFHPFQEWFHGYWGILVIMGWVWDFSAPPPPYDLGYHSQFVLFFSSLVSVQLQHIAQGGLVSCMIIIFWDIFKHYLSNNEDELWHCVLFCTGLAEHLVWDFHSCSVLLFRVSRKGWCKHSFPALRIFLLQLLHMLIPWRVVIMAPSQPVNFFSYLCWTNTMCSSR